MASQSLSTSTPILFNFKSTEVRTIKKDGLIWFVASDIAKGLNYSDATHIIRAIDDDEQSLHIVEILNGNQELIIINESGLYHALFKSRKPEAQAFRKWVTSEVLPAIRKTSSGALPQHILPAQQNALQQLVANKSGESGKNRTYIWSRFNNHFKLGSYKQLPTEQFVEAAGYLIALPLNEPVSLPPKSKYSYPHRLPEQSDFITKDRTAGLNIAMLSNTKSFVSPLLHLLNELRTNGHDVGAPWDEAMAMREGLIKANETLEKIALML